MNLELIHFPVDRWWQGNSNYFQLQPTLQHDSSNSLQNARRIGFIENRSVETQTQNLYQNEKRNDIKTNKTVLVVILGILLIACIAGVLAWFVAKKGKGYLKLVFYKMPFLRISECFLIAFTQSNVSFTGDDDFPIKYCKFYVNIFMWFILAHLS